MNSGKHSDSVLGFTSFSKVREALNFEMTKYITSSAHLGGKEYGFHFLEPTANVLMVITECLYQALDFNSVARVVDLDN